MPLNFPTGTPDDISFGPAVLFIGAAGSTPSTDVGYISEDGVSLEFTNEMRTIMQGNPKLPIKKFSQAQGVKVKLTSIEWNFDRLHDALGAGNTSASGTFEAFDFGGEPCPDELALHIRHKMCASGDTLNCYVWRAVGDGVTTLPFTHDEHKFPYSYEALQATTDWGGNALAYDEQLIQILREL